MFSHGDAVWVVTQDRVSETEGFVWGNPYERDDYPDHKVYDVVIPAYPNLTHPARKTWQILDKYLRAREAPSAFEGGLEGCIDIRKLEKVA